MIEAQEDHGEESFVLKGARVLVLVGALCLAALGLLGGSAAILVSVLDPAGGLLTAVIVSSSFLALTMGLGLAVAWQAWQAIQGKRSRPFQPRKGWILILVFGLVVAVGQTILSLDLLPAVTFPAFHVTAAVLPPLIVLALAGANLSGVTRWRDLVFQTSSGALVATFLAFTLEFAFVLWLLLAVFTAVAVRPGGLDLVQALAELLQDPARLQDLNALAFLFQSPVVLVAAFLVAAAAIPLIEEAVKTVGVALFAYRRPGLSQSYLWGLAGGAGFALAEGLFNSAGAQEAWAPVALMRAGATALHCFTGGLMGLAWYHVLEERRWGRGIGLYAASVGVHAVWNALTVAMTLLSLSTFGSEALDAGQMLANLGLVTVLALLACLILMTGLGLWGLTRYARRQSPLPEALEIPHPASDLGQV